MSTKENYLYVPRFVSQSSQITQIMNAKPDLHSKRKQRKLKISKTLFRVPDRKSPEIAANLSRKRKMKDCEKSEGTMSPNDDNVTTKGSALTKRQQGQDTSVCKQGMSCSVQDVFSFPSGTSARTKSPDSEVKQSVLKTISRMLEENRALRQRQLILSQATQNL